MNYLEGFDFGDYLMFMTQLLGASGTLCLIMYLMIDKVMRKEG